MMDGVLFQRKAELGSFGNAIIFHRYEILRFTITSYCENHFSYLIRKKQQKIALFIMCFTVFIMFFKSDKSKDTF